MDIVINGNKRLKFIKSVYYQPVPPLYENYLTIESLEDGLTVSFSTYTIQYSIDGCKTWVELPHDTTTPAINTGDKISFKATGLIPNSSRGIGRFTVDKNFNLKGNVMSILFGDEGYNNYSLTGYNYAFYKLFYNCTTLQSVSKNFLPATTLANTCYHYMFYGCSSLVAAPELPATILTEGCYDSMFSRCTSLVSVPSILPATTLAKGCYNGMFKECSSLVTAPELPATTVSQNCCCEMFSDCTSLITAPSILPATTLAVGCYYNMFRDCTSLVTAPELPATTVSQNCYRSMFEGCTSLTTAPSILPATTLQTYCYYYMFSDCTSLVAAPELPATTLANGCYNGMFKGCSALNYIKAMFTTTPGSSYTSSWVSGVSSTGTFVKNPDATWNKTGNSGIPTGWTIKNDGEENLITFYVDDTQYQAEEGMTWEEWVNSEYNVDEFWCDGDFYVRPANSWMLAILNITANIIKPSDVICDGCVYHTHNVGSGGGD